MLFNHDMVARQPLAEYSWLWSCTPSGTVGDPPFREATSDRDEPVELSLLWRLAVPFRD